MDPTESAWRRMRLGQQYPASMEELQAAIARYQGGVTYCRPGVARSVLRYRSHSMAGDWPGT